MEQNEYPPIFQSIENSQGSEELVPRELLTCTMSAQVNSTIGKTINKGMKHINIPQKQRRLIHC